MSLVRHGKDLATLFIVFQKNEDLVVLAIGDHAPVYAVVGIVLLHVAVNLFAVRRQHVGHHAGANRNLRKQASAAGRFFYHHLLQGGHGRFTHGKVKDGGTRSRQRHCVDDVKVALALVFAPDFLVFRVGHEVGATSENAQDFEIVEVDRLVLALGGGSEDEFREHSGFLEELGAKVAVDQKDGAFTDLYGIFDADEIGLEEFGRSFEGEIVDGNSRPDFTVETGGVGIEVVEEVVHERIVLGVVFVDGRVESKLGGASL